MMKMIFLNDIIFFNMFLKIGGDNMTEVLDKLILPEKRTATFAAFSAAKVVRSE